MKVPVIDKTKFMMAAQCIKAFGWSIKEESESRRERVSFKVEGKRIMDYAREVFPGGVYCGAGTDEENEKATREAIERLDKVIYRAHFGATIKKVKFTCKADIMVWRDGGYHVYMVKQGGRVMRKHYRAASYDAYVMRSLKMPITDFAVMLLDRKYVRKKKIDPKQLFITRSLMDEMSAFDFDIAATVSSIVETSKSGVPEIPIGVHCHRPYTCGYAGKCWPDRKGTIFSVGAMSIEQKFDLVKAGAEQLVDVDLSKDAAYDPPLTRNQKIQIESECRQKTFCDKVQIKSFLKKIQFPVYFLDLENFQPPMPLYEGDSPQEVVPFQYSLHVLTEAGELTHSGFLGTPGEDPRMDLLTQLLDEVGITGSVVVYDSMSERLMLNKLAHKTGLSVAGLNDRMIDISIPFAKRWYYIPAFNGVHRLKVVAPALNILTFKEDAIGNGAAAADAYGAMQEEANPELLDQLIEYCKQDTEALVGLYNFLRGLV